MGKDVAHGVTVGLLLSDVSSVSASTTMQRLTAQHGIGTYHLQKRDIYCSYFIFKTFFFLYRVRSWVSINAGVLAWTSTLILKQPWPEWRGLSPASML